MRLTARLLTALEWLTALFVFLMMVLTFFDVLGRYVFNAPIYGASEMIQFLLAASIFSAIGIVSARDQHVAVELFTPWLERRMPRLQPLIVRRGAEPHIMEGRNLNPLLHGQGGTWREYLISEYDYATREARQIIGNAQEDARLIMVRDARWKYVHTEGFRPMLFDLEADPLELTDLGGVEGAELDAVRARMSDAIFRWARRHHNRITVTPERVEAMTGKEPPGILIGYWDEADYEAVNGEPFPPLE